LFSSQLILDITTFLAGTLLGVSLVLPTFRPSLFLSRTTFGFGLSCPLPGILPYVSRFATLLALFGCVARQRCYEQCRRYG
jgi:hypothetical protein